MKEVSINDIYKGIPAGLLEGVAPDYVEEYDTTVDNKSNYNYSQDYPAKYVGIVTDTPSSPNFIKVCGIQTLDIDSSKSSTPHSDTIASYIKDAFVDTKSRAISNDELKAIFNTKRTILAEFENKVLDRRYSVS